MKNKLYILINFNKQKLKDSLLYFTGGFLLSTTLILYSDELTYRNVIKYENGYKGILNKITPRELIGTGAKKTFIHHQMDYKSQEEIYKEYIDDRNKENSFNPKQVGDNNELSVLMKRQKEKDILETYKRNIFDQK